MTRLADQKCLWTCMGLRDAKAKAQEIFEATVAEMATVATDGKSRITTKFKTKAKVV